jgi:transcriptional regulator
MQNIWEEIDANLSVEVTTGDQLNAIDKLTLVAVREENASCKLWH